MNQTLLQKYGGPVPRYTSYPTAPHFSETVGPEIYLGWLSALPESAPLSLYLHIPFCDSLCWFCGCNTKVVQRHEPIAAYLDLLIEEIKLVAERLEGPRRVRHIHLGGGSPTMLRPEDFAKLGAALDRAFTRTADAEVAVEIDPRGMTAESVEALASFGVTRASLGVQDLNPVVQASINRIQPYEVTAALVGMLREAGIEALNLDLMYGLPHQTVAGVEETASRCLALRPDRVALFGYAHVPQLKRHQRLIPEAALPGPAERWAQAEGAAAVLAEAGYRRIGLDHFARPDDPMAEALSEGRLNRNFQGYTDDEAPVLIGFGSSAIGVLPQGYVQNAVPLHDYRAAVTSGRLATAKGFGLGPDDRLRRAVIERLMCDLEVDLDAICASHGADPRVFAAERARLEDLEQDHVIEWQGPAIKVTEMGRPLVRSVACVFDSYLGAGKARHSQAV